MSNIPAPGTLFLHLHPWLRWTTTPVLGNILQMPLKHTHLHFAEWAKQYGGIYSLKISSDNLIILTSPRLVRDLLDKRNATTADRPPMRLVDMVTSGLHVAFARHGPTWKSLRRTLQQLVTGEACARHLPLQRAEATQLMYDMLKEPEGFFNHIMRHTTSIIYSAVFGTRAPRFENSLASEFADMLHSWEKMLEPGAHAPIDLLPILQHVPERWAPWKTQAREIRGKQQRMYYGLRDLCAKRISEDRRTGCFLEEVIENKKKFGLDDEMIAYVGGACLEGGADTVAQYLRVFVLCMATHPHVQARAQKEIDEVIGNTRAPSIEDIESLPYIRAIIQELHRFHPVTPLALPHATTTDEVVDGYYIPAGSTVIMNAYGIYHDENLYDRPEVFMPERFLDSEFGTKPGADTSGLRNDFPFGAGRRICIGTRFAQNTIVPNVMNLLWAFNFEIKDGIIRDKVVPIRVDDFEPGVTSSARPFKCDIKPRSQAHIDIIRSEYAQARSLLRLYEQDLSPEERAFIENW
ncbi:cytochrome P450 [Panus rudis PR-1116 ss-1]|nr:cytochrome P450 [Panus rudis PR-1116 ss-1]